MSFSVDHNHIHTIHRFLQRNLAVLFYISLSLYYVLFSPYQIPKKHPSLENKVDLLHHFYNHSAQTLKQHYSDRKSTRLNSSHVAISYAVFCLKKKTNTTGPVTSRTHATESSRTSTS